MSKFITIDQVRAHQTIRFNYKGKVREGIVEFLTVKGVQMHMTNMGGDDYSLLDEVHRQFHFDRIQGQILLVEDVQPNPHLADDNDDDFGPGVEMDFADYYGMNFYED